MKLKQLLIPAVILVLLLVGIALKQTQKRPEFVTQEYVPLDLSFETANVHKIDIAKPKGETEEEYVSLAKEGDGWRVTSHWNARADKSKVEALLKTLATAKGELRGTGKNLFSDFKIGDNDGYQVTLTDNTGTALLTLIMGLEKTNYQGLFVRRKDSEAIFLTTAAIYTDMGVHDDPAKARPSGEFWADTALADYDSKQVNRVESKRFEGGREFISASVKREGEDWKYTRQDLPFVISSEKVKQFIDGIKTWRASQVLDPEAKDKDYGFAKPDWQVTLGRENGDDIVITAGGKDESGNFFYFQTSGEPIVFQVSRFYSENLYLDDSRFFKENPFDIDAEKVTKLVVSAGKNQIILNPQVKKWEGLTTYLENLKNFHAESLIFDPKLQKKVKAKGKYWLEFQVEGQPSQFLDAGDLVDEAAKHYATQRRNNTAPFVISESTYRQLFDNLSSLSEPKA